VCSDGQVSADQAESFLSRIRRAEVGSYRGIAGVHLCTDAAEMPWREDNRRKSNGEQYLKVISAAVTHPVSCLWKGYWQRADRV
jgi:hypothetical protein